MSTDVTVSLQCHECLAELRFNVAAGETFAPAHAAMHRGWFMTFVEGKAVGAEVDCEPALFCSADCCAAYERARERTIS